MARIGAQQTKSRQLVRVRHLGDGDLPENGA
jgi:hypothetical protein